MTTWVTVSQASDILGMSERSVRRHIAEGKLEAKLDGNRRLVKVEVDDDKIGILDMTMSDKDTLIGWLRNELEEKNEQIKLLQDEIKQNRERSDAIIMKLTDELNAQRSMMEERQPRRKSEASFWRRLGRRDAGDDE
jgi:vacuolar-type H+-ATPase subunit I/STV1